METAKGLRRREGQMALSCLSLCPVPRRSFPEPFLRGMLWAWFPHRNPVDLSILFSAGCGLCYNDNSSFAPPVEGNNLTTVLEYLSSYRIHLRPFGKIDSGDVSWIPAFGGMTLG